ncbi:hypothetical protein BLNAU_18791 [Blattamonas nauphoetae]|uniref:Uncharacterized protein n=1 Tax=Blattamonas nauphoetae TaxID=2049346 RepID=A0ABQ9X7C7_9EUKA|nr:hypothetical protein BLNAU_18791 [Blattamonas nauphoetae]
MTSNLSFSGVSFHRDPNCEETPLFLRTEPNKLTTIEQVSQLFLSLVDFVMKGCPLDENVTRQTCDLLESFAPDHSDHFSADQILYELVPKPDGSCSGFTESIIPLLTSSNEALVQATLSLLSGIVLYTSSFTHFDILETGLFKLLPQAFYEQEMHLLAKHSFSLMNLVRWFILDSESDPTRAICDERQLSIETFQHIFIDHFFHPVGPFLESVFRHRRRFVDCRTCWEWSELLGSIFECSPSLEQMTLFVLSSSFALTFTDCVSFAGTSPFTNRLLWFVRDRISKWKKEGPAVQKRGQQILTKLSEEGLSEEFELHLRTFEDGTNERRNISMGAQLIHLLG